MEVSALAFVFISLLFLLSIGYVFVIGRLSYAWKSLPDFNIPKNFQSYTFISVLVPARNEEDSIDKCLDALSSQNYPDHLYEIIIIDDHSTDRTAALVRRRQTTNIKLLQLADYLEGEKITAFKKKALEVGVAHAQGSLIVTTDADCIVPPEWLLCIASFHDRFNYKIFTGPVLFQGEQNLLEYFQSLDYLGMMGATGGAIQLKWFRMGNGANMAYEKALFEEINGFLGIDQVASGDDMLLLQKAAVAYPDSIGFLKSKHAAVGTKAEGTWNGFMNQRLRWASKSAYYLDKKVLWVQATVFFYCFFILLSLLFIPWIGLFWMLGALFLKAFIDYIFLRSLAIFFDRKELMSRFWVSFLTYFLYMISLGLGSLFKKKYTWKGRAGES